MARLAGMKALLQVPAAQTPLSTRRTDGEAAELSPASGLELAATHSFLQMKKWASPKIEHAD